MATKKRRVMGGPHANHLTGRRKAPRPLMILVGLLVGLVGSYMLISSHAATAPPSIEAEVGTLSGSASIVADSTASGGSAVKFGSSSATEDTCPAFPSFPTAGCTGVPTGYSLTTVANLSSTSNSQTIDGKLITGDLTINNNNVTITNTRVKGRIINRGHTALVLQNVDIGPDSCPGSSDGSWYAVDPNSDGFTLKQVHVHNIPNDPIRLGGDGNSILIQDSLIDTTCYYTGDHLDGAQWYDPTGLGHVSIIHTSIDVRPTNKASEDGNSAVFWADGAASGTTLTMYNDRFAGGQISTALYDATKGSGIVLDVHDNVYVKGSYADGPCSFGTSTHSIVYDGTSGVKYTNNKLDDGTAVSCN